MFILIQFNDERAFSKYGIRLCITKIVHSFYSYEV